MKNSAFRKKTCLREKAITWIRSSFTEVVKFFFISQMLSSGKKPKGRRFSLSDKLIAIAIWKTSSAAYLLKIIFSLPSLVTLSKVLRKITINPGIHTVVFDGLKELGTNMKPLDKYCVLMFDEMSLSPEIKPNFPVGHIEGFVDYGYRRTGDIAKHVQVLSMD